jgi:hypothetical protein
MSTIFTIHDAIICDYATQSVGGKATLVNVFGGDILLSTIPTIVRIGVYCVLTSDGEKTVDATLHFKFAGYPIPMTAKFTIPPSTLGNPAILIIPQIDVQVGVPGDFEVEVHAEGYDNQLVIKRQIRLMSLSS